MYNFDPSKIKLVVSDLDGTLLNGASALSAYNIEQVRKLHDKGVLFTFATGRMDKMTWHFAEPLELKLPIISSNGAVMRYHGADEAIYFRSLAREQVAEIIRICEESDTDFAFYSADTVYHAPKSTRVHVFEHYNKLAITSGQPLIRLANVYAFANNMPPEEVTKVYIRFNPGDNADSEVGRRLAAIPGVQPSVSGRGSLELMPENTSKGSALEALCDYMNIPLENVLTIGDEQNDVSMLKRSGVSVGMRSGAPVIDEYVDFYAEHHNADGFGRMLKQIFSL